VLAGQPITDFSVLTGLSSLTYLDVGNTSFDCYGPVAVSLLAQGTTILCP